MRAESAVAKPSHDKGAVQRLFSFSLPLGLALTDAAADLAEASQHLAEQTRLMHLTGTSAKQMAHASDATAKQLISVKEAVADAGNRMAKAAQSTFATVAEAQACAASLAATANDIDVRSMAAASLVGDLGRSSDGIHKIAREIQMLAVNAGVEAARHGAAGRGFAVIAEAIKGLADQTRLATDEMGKHLMGLGGTVASLQGSCKLNLDHAHRMDDAASEAARQSDMLGAAKDAVIQAAMQLGQAVSPIGQLARMSQEIGASMQTGSTQLDCVSDRISSSSDRVGDILKLSEGVVSCLMTMDAELPISGLAGACQETAKGIGELFEASIRTGDINQEDLFDDQYRPIEGTNPQQFMTRFTALTDKLLPDIQERVLASDPRIIFCAAVDRNGYLPTHNRKFSQPQSHDAVWNVEHARNRRIFCDRSGLAAARNRSSVLLQSYRRDMGGGRFVVMSELTSPILVNGKHWGALRLAFQFQEGAHVRMG